MLLLVSFVFCIIYWLKLNLLHCSMVISRVPVQGYFEGTVNIFFSSGATFMLGSAGGCVGFDTGAVCLSAVSSGTFRDCRRVW